MLLAEGVDVRPRGRDAWAVAVLALVAGTAAAVTSRVPVSSGYPAAVVWGLGATAARSLPRRRPPGVAAAAGAAAVGAAAVAAGRR
ncbi:hypothetical protein [Geodermatophilus sp. SYSU D01105]